ncbi:hypothetical protein J6590_092460 [Homalodisca vitripennis]|nr:hypothetical protein J6590_092460 [Homalodisca vitripennis]
MLVKTLIFPHFNYCVVIQERYWSCSNFKEDDFLLGQAQVSNNVQDNQESFTSSPIIPESISAQGSHENMIDDQFGSCKLITESLTSEFNNTAHTFLLLHLLLLHCNLYHERIDATTLTRGNRSCRKTHGHGNVTNLNPAEEFGRDIQQLGNLTFNVPRNQTGLPGYTQSIIKKCKRNRRSVLAV